MERIVEVLPLEKYKVRITFASGVIGIFDATPYLDGPAFIELKDTAYFKTVRPIRHGIAWPHEQDFSADTIIHDMVPIPRDDTFECRSAAEAPSITHDSPGLTNHSSGRSHH